ncbi:carbamoyl phosphate synthase large subunit [Candidatus Desantisbacteria bacterium CG_4_10_14_0_8_um_filter_48_22]|uniref:Carbamoyl phosphate synthase large chain n=1 Tax=Candidatus Desantisbacteria bacterium CG_4_10_14_0_8_um_filter_48_22 TaxID=1974543 RepID=A0A2M7SF25_9BACT|nr:MAG: carbamoyl phosphate synthase large subunit [Candidatus Desantisbacteria bacterium CG02_land_8_20_14_3_00_49_13]PIZ18080.1 MAG: carbamoyl phosphate synthase large subunit [Candidatus Desantisbacteria bacterium CG_4_10_14_0_8_um_filter_48_22]
MAKLPDINKVLIIGSGPIIIGQACEFDYSGTQACKALRSMGYKIILVNSNPATIMTDPGMADITYIEPLTAEFIEKIIEKERPDALLPNLGGQTGLNMASDLFKKGILQKYGTRIIGVQADAIERGEDRLAFKETMQKLDIPLPQSDLAYSVEEALEIAKKLGYPVIVRPAYTMGGTGGGTVFNEEELKFTAARGITASLIGQILIEKSVIGWEELELEVVRDRENNMITVCFIENIDPMGVHTGDSFCSAPMLTISKEVQDKLQEYSYRIVEAIGVIGGTNIQFAHNSFDDRIVAIEINPRTSRSSALASKATGFPIAWVSSRLAGGDLLKDIPYWRDGTLDKYTPSGDYVVIKFARWAFEKFPGAKDKLGTEMKAVGEIMSIGKNYKEAFQKSIRGLENNRYGLGFAKNFNKLSADELRDLLRDPSSERQFIMYEALRKGVSVDELYEKTKIKKWFIEQMKELVEFEEELILKGQRSKLKNKKLDTGHWTLDTALLRKAKEWGFSDRYLGKILGIPEEQIRNQRKKINKTEAWDKVPVSGASAYYYYSTYCDRLSTFQSSNKVLSKTGSYNGADKVETSDKKKIMILGGGPNRIGQGIEFDYCCVHCSLALKELGYETIMVNSNPETVSTDYDTSDKLYFEPLTLEDVLSIVEKEKPLGVIVQLGGQTPLNLTVPLQKAGVNILGTSPDSIDIAEDRERFKQLLDKLKLKQAENGTAFSFKEAKKIASEIGYPVMVRPSYVLGGRAMRVVYDESSLEEFMAIAVEASPEHPILVDKFLEDAIEIDVDAVADGDKCVVCGIMEHIEEAGIHSGDSASVIPPFSLSDKVIAELKESTYKMAKELKVIGLMNVQYAIKNETIYVLEVNPRASRTVPFVSKATGVPWAKIASKVMVGKKLKELGIEKEVDITHVAVKESVFPFNRFPGVDPILGPEMKSTGEVMGIDREFGLAFAKSQIAAGTILPVKGNVFISVKEKDKRSMIFIAKKLADLGFRILATKGTAKVLENNDIQVTEVQKIHEGRPNVVDMMKNKEIQLLINTPSGKKPKSDQISIRAYAVMNNIPIITTVSGAQAAVNGIESLIKKQIGIKSLQEYHKE